MEVASVVLHTVSGVQQAPDIVVPHRTSLKGWIEFPTRASLSGWTKYPFE